MSVVTIDVEAMLRACVPGGSVVDPQLVCDEIRAYCSALVRKGDLSRIWFWPGGWIVSPQPGHAPREDATPITGIAEEHFFRLHREETVRALERPRCPVIGCTATTPHVHATARSVLTEQQDQDRIPVELVDVPRVLDRGDGFWRSCSGCYESNEGWPRGLYSEVFRCQLGSGCDECGGIGAVWDATDYDAAAEALQASEGAEQPAVQPAGEARGAARNSTGTTELSGGAWEGETPVIQPEQRETLHIGASIFDDRLHVVVMRKDGEAISAVADAVMPLPIPGKRDSAAVAALVAQPAAPLTDAVLAEVGRAITKFPTWPTDPLHAIAVLGEEFGELTKAALQLVYEPHKTSAEEVRTEAIQTAAMALRFLASLDRYEYRRSEQHQQLGIETEGGDV